MEFVLTKMIFAIDVEVLISETFLIDRFLRNYLLSHVQFLKTLAYLYEAFVIREKGTSAKKLTLREEKEDVDKICIEVQKLLTTQVENLHAVSHFDTKHLVL